MTGLRAQEGVWHRPVGDEEDSEGGEERVPPPQHEVDLLVDDVLGEDAEPVVHLLAPARPHVGDVARGHRGEDRAHRVPDQRQGECIINEAIET